MKITVSRKAHFNAAHRLHNPELSLQENQEIFGKCNNEYYHGHNYDLIVHVTGEVDAKSGYLIDMKVLRDHIKNEVEDYLDHKNLNLDIPHFKDVIPTTENLAIFIWNKLKSAIKIDCKLSIVLYETPRNYVEYSG